MQVSLRKVNDSELSEIAVMAERIWKIYYSEFISMEQIVYMLNKFYSNDSMLDQVKNGQRFYFIEHENQVKGFTSMSKNEEGNYFIHKLYIDPVHHASKIGSEVIACLESLMNIDPSKGESFVTLTVNRENYKAINFYFKNGFKIDKVENFDIGEGYFMTDFVMKKQIKK